MKSGLVCFVGLLLLALLVGCSSKPTAQYVRTSWVEGMEGNNYIFESLEELENYYNENKEVYYLQEDFTEAIKNYDDKYFSDHNLVLILLEEGSGSVKHEVKSYQMVDGYLKVNIDRVTPKYGTCDMAGWHIFIEVEKLVTSDYLGIEVEQF